MFPQLQCLINFSSHHYSIYKQPEFCDILDAEFGWQSNHCKYSPRTSQAWLILDVREYSSLCPHVTLCIECNLHTGDSGILFIFVSGYFFSSQSQEKLELPFLSMRFSLHVDILVVLKYNLQVQLLSLLINHILV